MLYVNIYLSATVKKDTEQFTLVVTHAFVFLSPPSCYTLSLSRHLIYHMNCHSNCFLLTAEMLL